MKRLLASLLAPFLSPAKAVEPAIEIDRLIHAIKQIENWDGYSIGKSGERGALQWKEATWRQFSSQPHVWAELRGPSFVLVHRTNVERNYARWLVKAVSRLYLAPTVYNVGLLHNAGYGNVKRGRITDQQDDFAIRLMNVYYDQPKPKIKHKQGKALR